MPSGSTDTTGSTDSVGAGSLASAALGVAAGRLAQAAPPGNTATRRNDTFGRPGISARATSTAAATANGRDLASNWTATSSPRCDSADARVVIRPPDIET